MLIVGFTTPFRAILLVLIKRFCIYDYPGELISRFAVYVVKQVLNEESFRETCSEPRLRQVFEEIQTFSSDPNVIDDTIDSIWRELVSIDSPGDFDEFISSLKSLFEDDPDKTTDSIVLDKSSVFGIFVRRCRIDYLNLSLVHKFDVFKAYHEYIQGISGDSEFTTGQDPSFEGWISEYNTKEFLKSQAEKIERTGSSNISSAKLHDYLVKIEKYTPHITNIRQVRYLNYSRSKEYLQSRFHLHMFFDLSLDKGADVQYALLNLGILEYKFGHLSNALSALEDALSAARSNMDEYCLQEVEFWISVCKKNDSFSESSSYTDDYLKSMETLACARDMLEQGGASRYVFELLYKCSINTIMTDIKHMDRAQFLITSIAWQKRGNSVLAKSYLGLAQMSGDESVENIEKTIIAEANSLQDLGDSGQAIKLLDKFSTKYPSESDFLMAWRQARARILRQSNKKRPANQEDMLQFTNPVNSEEYFSSVHHKAEKLILEKEFEKALHVLAEVHDYIKKTDQTSQLGYNLLLQASAYLKTSSIRESIPILIKSLKQSKMSGDPQSYYNAAIKLSEAYVRINDPTLVEKAAYMLDSIFPKVLLIRSKSLECNLYLAYAEVLIVQNKNVEALDYLTKAQEGYESLNLKFELLKTLHFKSMLQLEIMSSTKEVDETLRKIRNLQSQQNQ